MGPYFIFVSDERHLGTKNELWDWYTATLGKKSNERFAVNSLKVADLSIDFLKTELGDQIILGSRPELGIRDNASTLARFNDEKAWVEFEVTRAIQIAGLHKSVWIRGVVKGVHSEWVYKRLEDAHDGIIDFKIDDEGGEVKDFMRIRSLRSVRYDSRWHSLKIGDNSEVTLEK